MPNPESPSCALRLEVLPHLGSGARALCDRTLGAAAERCLMVVPILRDGRQKHLMAVTPRGCRRVHFSSGEGFWRSRPLVLAASRKRRWMWFYQCANKSDRTLKKFKHKQSLRSTFHKLTHFQHTGHSLTQGWLAFKMLWPQQAHNINYSTIISWCYRNWC